jgi:hypothetical protein
MDDGGRLLREQNAQTGDKPDLVRRQLFQSKIRSPPIPRGETGDTVSVESHD